MNPALHRQAAETEPWQGCNAEVLRLGAVFQRNGKGCIPDRLTAVYYISGYLSFSESREKSKTKTTKECKLHFILVIRAIVPLVATLLILQYFTKMR